MPSLTSTSVKISTSVSHNQFSITKKCVLDYIQDLVETTTKFGENRGRERVTDENKMDQTLGVLVNDKVGGGRRRD